MQRDPTYLAEDIEISIAAILTDPVIRDKAAIHVELWMFKRAAIRAYLEVVLKPEFFGRRLPLPIVTAQIKQNSPKLEKEDWEIILFVIDSNPVDKNDVHFAIEICEGFISECLKKRGYEAWVNNRKSEGQEYLNRAISFKITSDSFIDPTDEDLVMKLKLLDMPPEGTTLKSSIGLLNHASMFNGFKPGDLAMILGAPKRGKSTLLVQEGASLASQGCLVAHAFFGDMSEYDGLCKYITRLNHTYINKVIFSPLEYLRPVKNIMSRVRISAYPAMSKSVYDVLSELRSLHKSFPFGAFIIDYDSNIIPPAENMYESGGLLYSLLKGFAQQTKSVGFVASQPKIANWADETMADTAAAESSRKQHVVDFMITLGRNPKCHHVGMINIPLVRRGESGLKGFLKFEDSQSKIEEISEREYNEILKRAEMDKSSKEDITVDD